MIFLSEISLLYNFNLSCDKHISCKAMIIAKANPTVHEQFVEINKKKDVAPSPFVESFFWWRSYPENWYCWKHYISRVECIASYIRIFHMYPKWWPSFYASEIVVFISGYISDHRSSILKSDSKPMILVGQAVVDLDDIINKDEKG